MKENTEKYKQKLSEEKKLLEEELKSIGAPNPRNLSDWEVSTDTNTERTDLNTKADVYEDIEERHAVIDTLEVRFQNVSGALERITKGTYGVCEVCNKEIEEARLDANPAALTCIEHVDTPIA